MKAFFLVLGLTFLFAGCASPGNPEIKIQKNVSVFILGNGNLVVLDYEQHSQTETEAFLEFLQENNPDLKFPSVP